MVAPSKPTDPIVDGAEMPARPSTATLAAKRVLDLTGSAAGLVVLAPAFAVIAVLIKRDSKGPVFFKQTRIGQNGVPFKMYKFRSMSNDAPSRGPALTIGADPRITRIGAFLRRTKLDELPQLINVLAGQMSLVGPRPEVAQYMRMYTPRQRDILLTMKPGMTDYAAILFRDESDMLASASDPIKVYRDEIMPIKFRHYARYGRDVGVWNDVRIILATVYAIAMRRTPAWLEAEQETGPRKSALQSLFSWRRHPSA